MLQFLQVRQVVSSIIACRRAMHVPTLVGCSSWLQYVEPAAQVVFRCDRGFFLSIVAHLWCFVIIVIRFIIVSGLIVNIILAVIVIWFQVRVVFLVNFIVVVVFHS